VLAYDQALMVLRRFPEVCVWGHLGACVCVLACGRAVEAGLVGLTEPSPNQPQTTTTTAKPLAPPPLPPKKVWYDYARWHAESGGGPDDALKALAAGSEAQPDCLMLHFALADAHEAAGRGEEARQVGRTLEWGPGGGVAIGVCQIAERLVRPIPKPYPTS
jgi:hypothetical protein